MLADTVLFIRVNSFDSIERQKSCVNFHLIALNVQSRMGNLVHMGDAKHCLLCLKKHNAP